MGAATVDPMGSLSPDERAAALERFELGYGMPYDPEDPHDRHALAALIRTDREAAERRERQAAG